jgi:hypothetical protein
MSAASADTLDMNNVNIGSDDGRPTRGMTKARVESKYGSPNTKSAAVGDPPISRWDYQDYVVFFEYDHVIHAVRRR